MKICITADLQFAEHARYSRVLPNGLTSRLQDILDCWAWIVDESASWSCDALVIVGDVFDSRTTIDLPVIDTVCRAFHEASKRVKLYILVGNHDSYLKTPAINSIQAFRGFAEIYEEPMVKPWSEPVAFVPWMDDVTAFRKAIESVAKKGVSYLFTHAMVEGAVPGGKGIPLSYLQPHKFARVFLGDVHDPLDLAENVHYVGSPLQIDYRDAGGRRGFCILDTEDDEFTFIENERSPRFHILDDADTEAVRPGDFVRVKTDDPDIAAEAVEAVKGKAQWVESECVEVEDQEPRMDVRTKDAHGDVLRCYCEHQGFEGEDADKVVALGMDILEEART